MKLNVIIEKNDTELYGRIEGIGNFMPVVIGETPEDVQEKLLALIRDYREHEGKEDTAWLSIDLKTVEFEIHDEPES